VLVCGIVRNAKNHRINRSIPFADQVDEDCDKSLFFGCNLLNGKCKCGQEFACSNPYQFNSQHLCYMEQNEAGESKLIMGFSSVATTV